MNHHLTEEEIQECAADEMQFAKNAHLKSCGHCRAQVEQYRMLFNEISVGTKADFEFDVAALVMPQLQHKKAGPFLSGVLVLVAILSSAGAALYVFRKNLLSLIKGVEYAALEFMGILFIVGLSLLVFDQYRIYKKKLQQLDQLSVK